MGSPKKISNLNVILIQISLAVIITAFTLIMIGIKKKQNATAVEKQNSTVRVSTPEALDSGYYGKILDENLSYAENEEHLEE